MLFRLFNKDERGQLALSTGMIIGAIAVIVLLVAGSFYLARRTVTTVKTTPAAEKTDAPSGSVTLSDEQFKALLAGKDGGAPAATCGQQDKDGYGLTGKLEVATHSAPGWFLHVQYHFQDGTPERETVLDGGRYPLPRPLGGHVWEYGPNCTRAQVEYEMTHPFPAGHPELGGSIERRTGQKAKTIGVAPADEVARLFRKVG